MTVLKIHSTLLLLGGQMGDDLVLLHGDCLSVLKDFPDNSIDSIVTDPPYGLSFMGKKWDYDVPSVEIWKEVLRVLKPGGHVLSFGGTRTYHRMVVNMEDAGFEIRDQIQWLYGSGFPKSHNMPGGLGTALKPANEPICLARKPISEKTVAANVLKHGTGGLNIDGARIGTEMIQGGRSDASSFNVSIGEKPPMHQGRWPANIILDEEAAAMLDEQTEGKLHGAGKQREAELFRVSTGDSGINSKGKNGTNFQRFGDTGGASRFFYVAKASKRERNRGLEGMPTKNVHRYGPGIGEGIDPNAPSKDKNFHPTVKPIKLMEYLIKLITPPNGVVLDPFMGSGSTGVAAKNLGFPFIGIEMNEEYVEIAKRRIG